MNHSRSLTLFPLLAALAAAPLVSQSTWHVGPGADFEDLATAVDRVAAGDILVLRPGTHSSPTIRRGITILAKDATVGELSVRTVPPTESVRIHGLDVQNRIDLYGSHGPVHLERCAALGLQDVASVLRISACALVTVTNCRFELDSVNLPPCERIATVEIADSLVSFVASSARGTSASFTTRSTPAMRVDRSEVHLCNPALSGGAGWESTVLGTRCDPSPGLVLVDAQTAISGDHTASCRRGDAPWGATTVRDLVAERGRVRIDPGCGIASASVRNLRATVVSRVLESVIATGVAPGESMPMELFAAPGDLVVAFVGLPAWPVAVSTGTLWVESTSMLEVGSAVLTGRSWITSVRLPSSVVIGQALVLQGSVLRSEYSMVLTEPVTVVLPEGD